MNQINHVLSEMKVKTYIIDRSYIHNSFPLHKSLIWQPEYSYVLSVP